MNFNHSASSPAIRASEPWTIGMFPDPIHAFCSSVSRTAVEKNFFAVSFSASLAFEEIDRY